MKIKKKAVFWFVMLIIMAILFEASSYAFINLARERYSEFFYVSPGREIIEKFSSYRQRRDNRLGWPAPSDYGTGTLDRSGARVQPAFPSPGQACVSVYGNSFAFGEEVSDAEAWTNQLALRLGCRVANYGVGGYGTDQAFIRFIVNSEDESEIVILTVFPHNFLRNVNQFRHFITGRAFYFGFKPRFVLGQDGTLTEVPMPAIDYENYLEVFQNPSKHLSHDFFAPGSDFSPVSYKFPYTLRVVQLLLNPRIHHALATYLEGTPYWERFFTPGDGSQSFEISTAIVESFAALAKDRGKRFLLVFFPTPRLFSARETTTRWTHDPFLQELRDQGILILDLARGLESRWNTGEYCGLLTDPDRCKGHFNPDGNRLVANAAYETILTMLGREPN